MRLSVELARRGYRRYAATPAPPPRASFAYVQRTTSHWRELSTRTTRAPGTSRGANLPIEATDIEEIVRRIYRGG